MPFDSGLVNTIKGHGNFNPEDQQRLNFRDPLSSRQDNINQIKSTKHDGIVLIRNPFYVIYSYRNYVEMGTVHHAEEYRFSGPGNTYELK